MFIDLLRSRRSIRQFEKRPVEKAKIDLLVEAALRSPSSRGFNPWEFIVVDNPELIDRLSDVWVEDVSIAAIILHLAATDLGLGSCWIQLRKRDRDATQTAGEYAAEVLGLPKGMEVSSIMAIGYPAQHPKPHPNESLLRNKVSVNGYGAKK